MNIETFKQIKSLLTDRHEVITKLRVVKKSEEGNGGFGVMINGQYQEDEVLDGLRPYMISMLIDNLARIDDNLISLGFEPDLPEDFSSLQPDWDNAVPGPVRNQN